MWVKNSTGKYQLLATAKDGKVHLNAYLDDYAFLLDALIELMQADYRTIDMQFAEDIAEALLDNFEADDGGFYFTSHQHEQLIHRPKSAYDNATPNGNGIAAVALQRLGHILGEPRYLQIAERALQAFDTLIKRNPAGCASLSHALNEYLTPPTLVIVRGQANNLSQWRREIGQHYYPHHIFFYLDETITSWDNIVSSNVQFHTIVLVISDDISMTKSSLRKFDLESSTIISFFRIIRLNVDHDKR